MTRKPWLVLAMLLVGALASEARELTRAYIVPVAANKIGVNGTDWHTDLTIYNPQKVRLPMVIQFLETGRNNGGGAPTLDNFYVLPWETFNLWDVLGPHGFNRRGVTGALLVYADDQLVSCTGHDCDFAVFSRTYTLDPRGGSGEYGQDIPGFPLSLGLDRSVLAFMPQLMDDESFRTNAGVASFSNANVTVRFELQDKDGNIINKRDAVLLPYTHLQWHIERGVTGGTLAAYITGGPGDAMVFPYASVVNNQTGDPVYVEAHMTPVGVASVSTESAPPPDRSPRRPSFPARLSIPGFSAEALREQGRE